MTRTHVPWRLIWRRLLFVLACLQVCEPEVAAVADGWRVDTRAPVAHAEAPGATGCVVVHDEDCVLCAIATNPPARPAGLLVLPAVASHMGRPSVTLAYPTSRSDRWPRPSRAPPASFS